MATQYYESEQCFRRYEDCIVQAVISYPQEVRFKPTVRTLATDTARCRDALASWRLYKWKTAIDQNAYKEVISELSVWHSMGYVCIGPKATLRKLNRKKRPVKRPVSLTPEFLVAPVLTDEMIANGQSTFMPPAPIKAKLTDAEIQQLPIEQVVEMVENNETKGPFFFENTVENHKRVVDAIGDRMNVVFVITNEGQIRIF